MLLFMVGIGLASFTLWLLKLYIFGGWSNMPGGRNREKSLEDLFPPRSKAVEEELERRRKKFEQRKTKGEAGGTGDAKESKCPPKNFFDEADEYIAKRKSEVEERKRATGGTPTPKFKNKKKETKTFQWLNNPN